MYAIVKIAGRQYKAAPDARLKVDLIDLEAGAEFAISDVLMIADGDDVRIGDPNLPYQVKLEVIEHARRPKVITATYKRRGGMRRKTGHRQQYTVVKVKAIEQEA